MGKRPGMKSFVLEFFLVARFANQAVSLAPVPIRQPQALNLVFCSLSVLVEVFHQHDVRFETIDRREQKCTVIPRNFN